MPKTCFWSSDSPGQLRCAGGERAILLLRFVCIASQRATLLLLLGMLMVVNLARVKHFCNAAAVL